MEISGSRSFTLSLAFLLLSFCSGTCNAKDDTSAKSCTSSCGHVHNISYPFRLNDDPKYCGDVRYTLSCESNITVLYLPSSGKYYVQAINYNDKTIRLLDPGLVNTNCSSMPRNFPHNTLNYYEHYSRGNLTSIYYLKCSNPLNSSLYVDTAPCLNNTGSTSSSQPKTYSYVMVGEYLEVWELDEGCSAEGRAWMNLGHFDYSVKDYSNVSYKDIHNALVYGFELHFWPGIRCQGWNYGSSCFPDTIPESHTRDCEVLKNSGTSTTTSKCYASLKQLESLNLSWKKLSVTCSASWEVSPNSTPSSASTHFTLPLLKHTIILT